MSVSAATIARKTAPDAALDNAATGAARRATFRRATFHRAPAARRRRSGSRIASRIQRAKCSPAIARDHRRANESGELHAAFAATRVGTLIDRLRLHLRTDRFLAERRQDAEWQAACDFAARTLARIASRMKPRMLAERVISRRAARRR